MNLTGYFLMKSRFLFLILVWQVCFAATAKAENENPHAVVQYFTDEVMAVIRSDGAVYKADPEKYFYRIQKKLESSVDLRFIAKKVMGVYGETASKEQHDRFFKIFSQNFVEILARGLASYADLSVVTLPFDSSKEDLTQLVKVEVVQQIEAVDGTSYVSYTMAKEKSGQWKMVNVILNGANLGKQFRNQFIQEMKVSDNNIDKVINNWSKTI